MVMDIMECADAQSGVRKVKKKLVKDELDRLKKAEKKKRRLEKALATSAAIISELEKKKQKKKEEQQRLDEEGAAIAEAVALHVLLGEEDSSDESCKIMLNKGGEEFNPWDCASKIDICMSRRTANPDHYIKKQTLDGIGWVSNVHGSGYKLNDCGRTRDFSVSSGHLGSNLKTSSYSYERGWDPTDISVGLVAQAVSSLQISEDSHVGAALLVNRLLRG